MAPPTVSAVRGYCTKGSEVELLGDLDRIIDFDAEVAHGTLNLRVAERSRTAGVCRA